MTMTTNTTTPVSLTGGVLRLQFANENILAFTAMPCGERFRITALIAGVNYFDWTCHAYAMGTLINQIRTMRHNEKPDLSLLHIDQPEETIHDEEDEW